MTAPFFVRSVWLSRSLRPFFVAPCGVSSKNPCMSKVAEDAYRKMFT